MSQVVSGRTGNRQNLSERVSPALSCFVLDRVEHFFPPVEDEVVKSAYDLCPAGKWRPFPRRLRIVSPGFFRVMNISIVAGRSFTPDDRFGGDPVVVVNEAWARKFIGGLDPLRERVSPGAFGRRVDGKYVPLDAAIVGVARDVSYAALTAPAEPIVYVSAAQVIRPGGAFLVYQFSPKVLDFIKPHFDRIDRGFEWINVPPATLFWAWRKNGEAHD